MSREFKIGKLWWILELIGHPARMQLETVKKHSSKTLPGWGKMSVYFSGLPQMIQIDFFLTFFIIVFILLNGSLLFQRCVDGGTNTSRRGTAITSSLNLTKTDLRCVWVVSGGSPQTILLGSSFKFLGSELKKTADEILFLELALRGYDLSKLRDEEATGEVVRIG